MRTEEPSSSPPFRPTEYLLPILLVLLVAWGGWFLIQQSLQRARERALEREIRLPGNAPLPPASNRPLPPASNAP